MNGDGDVIECLVIPHLAAQRHALARDLDLHATDVVTGVGGKQIILEDPSGNPIELFQPIRDEARLGGGAGRPGS